LKAPAGQGTRPTADRVREALFSSLASLGGVEGWTVADLFAGSGALGIEALSRGAAGVLFVEQDPRVAAVIRCNLARLDLSPAKVIVADVRRWADVAPAVDLVLADPPYAFESWPALLQRLRAVAGLLVTETGDELDLGAGWEIVRRKRYGTTVITIARPTRNLDQLDGTEPGPQTGPDQPGYRP
jgi:16S rRNA (guanine966-N2)-methyltransferase